MLGVSAMGVCPVHKIDLMAIGLDETNLAPTCIKCKAAAEPKLGRPQTAEDPGEHFFNKGVPPMPKNAVLDSTPNIKEAEKVSNVPTLDMRYSYTVADVVEIAIAQLRKLPMPEDIKEFKRVQKVIKTLQSLVEKSNG